MVTKKKHYNNTHTRCFGTSVDVDQMWFCVGCGFFLNISSGTANLTCLFIVLQWLQVNRVGWFIFVL